MEQLTDPSALAALLRYEHNHKDRAGAVHCHREPTRRTRGRRAATETDPTPPHGLPTASYMLAISLLTRSSTDRNGSLHSTVR